MIHPSANYFPEWLHAPYYEQPRTNISLRVELVLNYFSARIRTVVLLFLDKENPTKMSRFTNFTANFSIRKMSVKILYYTKQQHSYSLRPVTYQHPMGARR